MAEELLRRRTAARGWLTRARKALESAIQADPVDKFILTDAIDEFDKRLSSLDEIQTNYELVCEDMNAEIEESWDFRDHVRKVRAQASNILVQFESPVAESSTGSTSLSKPNVRLPKISLPTFSDHFGISLLPL